MPNLLHTNAHQNPVNYTPIPPTHLFSGQYLLVPKIIRDIRIRARVHHLPDVLERPLEQFSGSGHLPRHRIGEPRQAEGIVTDGGIGIEEFLHRVVDRPVDLASRLAEGAQHEAIACGRRAHADQGGGRGAAVLVHR